MKAFLMDYYCCRKPCKVGVKYLEDGTKVRVSRGIGASGSIIPRPEILRIRTTPRPTVGTSLCFLFFPNLSGILLPFFHIYMANISTLFLELHQEELIAYMNSKFSSLSIIIRWSQDSQASCCIKRMEIVNIVSWFSVQLY